MNSARIAQQEQEEIAAMLQVTSPAEQAKSAQSSSTSPKKTQVPTQVPVLKFMPTQRDSTPPASALKSASRRASKGNVEPAAMPLKTPRSSRSVQFSHREEHHSPDVASNDSSHRIIQVLSPGATTITPIRHFDRPSPKQKALQAEDCMKLKLARRRAVLAEKGSGSPASDRLAEPPVAVDTAFQLRYPLRGGEPTRLFQEARESLDPACSAAPTACQVPVKSPSVQRSRSESPSSCSDNESCAVSSTVYTPRPLERRVERQHSGHVLPLLHLAGLPAASSGS